MRYLIVLITLLAASLLAQSASSAPRTLVEAIKQNQTLGWSITTLANGSPAILYRGSDPKRRQTLAIKCGGASENEGAGYAVSTTDRFVGFSYRSAGENKPAFAISILAEADVTPLGRYIEQTVGSEGSIIFLGTSRIESPGNKPELKHALQGCIAVYSPLWTAYDDSIAFMVPDSDSYIGLLLRCVGNKLRIRVDGLPAANTPDGSNVSLNIRAAHRSFDIPARAVKPASDNGFDLASYVEAIVEKPQNMLEAIAASPEIHIEKDHKNPADIPSDGFDFIMRGNLRTCISN